MGAMTGWEVLLFAFLLLLFKRFMLRGRTPSKNLLPPGPPALPIIGHLHLLQRPLHHWLARLASRYGPILFLRLGSRPVLVVSSPTTVEECFTKNDLIFANRPHMLSTKYLHYDSTTLSTAPYGDHWRNLRRLTVIHLFAASRVSSLSGLREEEIRAALRQIFVSDSGRSGEFRRVDMRSRIQGLAFNMMTRMVSGKSYHGDSATDACEGDRVRSILFEIMHLSNVSNVEDFLPALISWVNIRGMRRRMMGLRRRMNALFQGMVDERRHAAAEEKRGGTEKTTKTTFIDVLLELQGTESEYYTDEVIKGIIQALLTAGVETTFLLLEWTMALLLNHPEIMKKARAQVDAVVGTDRLLDSSDLPNLPYLHSIVKEALRYQQSGALLVPHQSSGECTVGGYRVPAGTMLLVNTYVIHRDPDLWTAPEEFRPERFEEGEGGGYSMMAFGRGRRRCPGEGLGMSSTTLVVGVLVQCFEWDRVGEEMVDVTSMEASGLLPAMAKPLEALCRPRVAMRRVLSQL